MSLAITDYLWGARLNFEKDHEVFPAIFAHRRSGQVIGGFVDMSNKDQVERLLLSLLQVDSAIEDLVLISETWSVQLAKTDDLEDYRAKIANGVSLKDIPGRKEMVAVHHFTEDQDILWYAEIHREPEKPPQLGPWKRMVATSSEGRFSNLFARARNQSHDT